MPETLQLRHRNRAASKEPRDQQRRTNPKYEGQQTGNSEVENDTRTYEAAQGSEIFEGIELCHMLTECGDETQVSNRSDPASRKEYGPRTVSRRSQFL